MTEKTSRNKTLTLSEKETSIYKRNLIKLADIESNEINKIINKTIQADTFEVLKKLPDKYFDLIIIDPPYNLSKKFNIYSFKRKDEEEYSQWFESWLVEIKRCLKPQGSLYICCDWKTSPIIYMIGKKFFHVQNRITWEREKGRGAKSNWKNSIEDILFFTNSLKEYTFNVDAVKLKRKVIAPYKNEEGQPKDWEDTSKGKFRITHPSNFWSDITIPFWSMPENTQHPTQKPEKLIAKLILASSNENDLILDPFNGSGTTSVVAKKLNRRFVGIEKDEYYCLLTEKRLALAEENKNIQGYYDNVFWERNSLNSSVFQKRKKKSSLI